jgi:AraC-like DNA-binding protein
MYRRWRVRHSYPKPVVELVQLLTAQHGVPQLARLLDIPMSVVYRWRARGTGRRACENHAARVATLLVQCDEVGFRFAERLRRAAQSPWQSLRLALAELSEQASAGLVPLRPLANRADRDRASCAENERELPVMPRPRYVFDARRQRPSRGVAYRLEAARRIIETEYFSEVDGDVLADAAQMSRHHFIRMFSDAFGMSPHQYLTRTRIEAAKRLLLSSRAPIEVIAAGVGFRSGPSLNRAFKQVEGASVSRFCQTARKDGHDDQPASSVLAVTQDQAVRLDK